MSTFRHVKSVLAGLEVSEDAKLAANSRVETFLRELNKILFSSGTQRTRFLFIEDARRRLVHELDSLLVRHNPDASKNHVLYLRNIAMIQEPSGEAGQPGPWQIGEMDAASNGTNAWHWLKISTKENVAGVKVLHGPFAPACVKHNVQVVLAAPLLLVALRRAVLLLARLESASNAASISAAFAGVDPLLDDLTPLLAVLGGLLPGHPDDNGGVPCE